MSEPAKSSKSGMVTNKCQLSQPTCHETPSQVDLTQTPLTVPHACWGSPKDILSDSSGCQRELGSKPRYRERRGTQNSTVLGAALLLGSDKSC